MGPPAQAASVVLAATQPAASEMSIPESVLAGLNPYHPNQRMTPPTAARVMLCAGMGAAAVALELPADARAESDSARERDEAADGVDDGRSGEVAERERAGSR